MRDDNKKVNKFLIISNIIFIISLATVVVMNYKNYKDYISSEKNLISTKDKIKNNENIISELNKKINTKDSDRTAQINEVSIHFLNAFLSSLN